MGHQACRYFKTRAADTGSTAGGDMATDLLAQGVASQQN